MVEVLKKGRGFICEIVCKTASKNGCGALLGINRDDCRYSVGGGWADHDASVSVRCPECGTIIDLKEKDWPQNAHTLKPYTDAWAKSNNDD